MSQASPQDYLQQALLAGDARRAAGQFTQLQGGLTTQADVGRGNDYPGGDFLLSPATFHPGSPASRSHLNQPGHDKVAFTELGTAPPIGGSKSQRDPRSTDPTTPANLNLGTGPGSVVLGDNGVPMQYDLIDEWVEDASKGLGDRTAPSGRERAGVRGVERANERPRSGTTARAFGAEILFGYSYDPTSVARTCYNTFINYITRETVWKAFAPSGTEEGKGEVPGLSRPRGLDLGTRGAVGPPATSPEYPYVSYKRGHDGVETAYKEDLPGISVGTMQAAAASVGGRFGPGTIVCIFTKWILEAYTMQVCPGTSATTLCISSAILETHACFDSGGNLVTGHHGSRLTPGGIQFPGDPGFADSVAALGVDLAGFTAFDNAWGWVR